METELGVGKEGGEDGGGGGGRKIYYSCTRMKNGNIFSLSFFIFKFYALSSMFCNCPNDSTLTTSDV